MLISSPPSPNSARALPATPITAANAAIAPSKASAAGSGRCNWPTRPSQARVWTVRIVRAAEFADQSNANTAKIATDHQVPADSFEDSPTDSSNAGPTPTASPACLGALGSSFVASPSSALTNSASGNRAPKSRNATAPASRLPPWRWSRRTAPTAC